MPVFGVQLVGLTTVGGMSTAGAEQVVLMKLAPVPLVHGGENVVVSIGFVQIVVTQLGDTPATVPTVHEATNTV